ncbi:MAG: HAD-IB family phosphatase [Bacilli bacterium]|nr:HAD-IB family phosphatase [Bacilli bacterium]
MNKYIIADFDHTLTDKDSTSSWGVLETLNTLNKEAKNKLKDNKNYYLPLENNLNINEGKRKKLMREWTDSNLKILNHSNITKKDIKKASYKKNAMKIRKGVKELLKYTYINNVPVIIVSAGIKEIIENFLKANNCLYENIYIVSNKIKYKNNIFIGFKNKIIYPSDKHKIKYSHKIKKTLKGKGVLLGDNISDTLMNPNNKQNILKIGFLNNYTENKELFKNAFDIVYEDKVSFKEIINIIKKL